MGCPFDTAAITVGVRPRTLRQWMSEDEEIAMQVLEASAACELEDLKVIDDAVHGTDMKLAVSTAQWRLERTNPAAWGRTTRNDQYSHDQLIKARAEELRLEGIDISDEELKELWEQEQKSLGNGKEK